MTECPKCGEDSKIVELLSWDEYRLKVTQYQCDNCGHVWEERHRA